MFAYIVSQSGRTERLRVSSLKLSGQSGRTIGRPSEAHLWRFGAIDQALTLTSVGIQTVLKLTAIPA